MDSEEDDRIASPGGYDSEEGSPAADSASEEVSKSYHSESDADNDAGVPRWTADPESPPPSHFDEDEESEVAAAQQRGPHTPSDNEGETVETPESPSENSAGSSDEGESPQNLVEGGEVEPAGPEQVDLEESPQSPPAVSDEEDYYIINDDEPDEGMEAAQEGDTMETWKATETFAEEKECDDNHESSGGIRDESMDDRGDIDEDDGIGDDIAREEASEDGAWTREGLSDNQVESAEVHRTSSSPEHIDSPSQEIVNNETSENNVPMDQDNEFAPESDPVVVHRPPSPVEVPEPGMDRQPSEPTVVDLAAQTAAVSLDSAAEPPQLDSENELQSNQEVSAGINDSEGLIDQSVTKDTKRGSDYETSECHARHESVEEVTDETISGKNNIDISQGSEILEQSKEEDGAFEASKDEPGLTDSPKATTNFDRDETQTFPQGSDQSKLPHRSREGAGQSQEAALAADQSEKAATSGASQSEMLEVHHLDDHAVELDYEEDVEDHEKVAKDGKEDGVEDGLIDGEEGEDDDDGELEEDEDMEEGEVKEPGSRKPFVKKVCRFYNEGKCTWGSNCRFIHPGVNDKGNYSMIDRRELHEATAKLLGIPQAPPAPAPARAFSPPPPPPSEPAVESAWERGLRHAKEIRKKAMMRKEQDHNFEEKRMLGGIPFEEERDFDKENDFTLPQGNANFEEFYGFTVADEESPPIDAREGLYQQQFEAYHADYERREPPQPPQQYDYRRAGKERQWQEEREEMERRDLARQRQREMNRMRERPRDIMRDRRTPPRPLSRERPLPGNSRPMREDHDRPPPRDDRRPKDMRGPPPPSRPSRPADAWQDPWARSRSPKPNVKMAGRRRRSYSYSTDSFSDSSFSSRSRSRSRSRSSYSSSSHSSSGSSFSSASRSRSRSYSRSRSPTPRGHQQSGGNRGRQAFRGGRQPAGRMGIPPGRSNQPPPGKAGPVGNLSRGPTTQSMSSRGGTNNRTSSGKGPASDVGQQSLSKRPLLATPVKPAMAAQSKPSSSSSSAPKQPPQLKGLAADLPRHTQQDHPRSHHIAPMQQKKPGPVVATDKRSTGSRKSPDPRKMPPGRQIRPRTRSSSGSSFTSHSSHSSYSSISRSRSRSISSVSSFSSISSSDSDMSPRRPQAMKGIDGKRLPPNTKLPKVGIPALQPRQSKAPTASTNRSTKPPPAGHQQRTAKPSQSSKPPPSAKPPSSSTSSSSKAPSKPPPTSSKPAAAGPGKSSASSKPAPGSKPPSKTPSSSRAPNGKQSPSRSSRAAPPSKSSQPPAKTGPVQAKPKSAPKPTAPSRDKEKEKTRGSSGAPPPSGASAPTGSTPATQRQHSTSAPVTATPRSNTLKVTAHKDIKLTLLNKPSADAKKRTTDAPSNQASKKSSTTSSQAKSSSAKDRKAARPPTASAATTKKPPSSSDANRKTSAPAYTSKPAPKPSSGERKRPPSPTPPKGQPPAKVPSRTPSTGAPATTAPGSKPASAAPAAKAGGGGAAKASAGATAKKTTTVSRREELLKQLRAVEDAIARKKAKLK